MFDTTQIGIVYHGQLEKEEEEVEEEEVERRII